MLDDVTVDALVSSDWVLPDILPGSITFKEILLESAQEIKPLLKLKLEVDERTISFEGGQQNIALIGSDFELKISLVDQWDQTTIYT